jgi:hypothetical protein
VCTALVMSVRDSIDKDEVLGALGVVRVRVVGVPSRYAAAILTMEAAEMARRLGVRYDEIAIARRGVRAAVPETATDENIQARVRTGQLRDRRRGGADCASFSAICILGPITPITLTSDSARTVKSLSRPLSK